MPEGSPWWNSWWSSPLSAFWLLCFCRPCPAQKPARSEQVAISNLRQINLGVRLYSDDSSDKAPHPEGAGTNKTLSVTGFKKLMRSYVGPNAPSSPKAKLFACPADTFHYNVSNNKLVLRTEPLHNQPFVDYSSYGFNGGNLNTKYNRLGIDVSQLGIAGRTISSIRNPVQNCLGCRIAGI